MAEHTREDVRVCSVGGCPRPVHAVGLCQPHYRLQRSEGTECLVADCEGRQTARGLCVRHYGEVRALEASAGATALCECGCGRTTNLVTATDRRRGIVIGQPRRFLPGHNVRNGAANDYVIADGGFPTECWLWQRGKSAAGYGMLRDAGRTDYAHRVYYRRHRGAIPHGWVVHHLCWNKACVNPEHLEAATLTANSQGCANGVDCVVARDRWVPRQRGKYLRFAPGELPYSSVDTGWSSDCWIWRRPLTKGGYPRTHRQGRDVYAHRAYYADEYGPIPDGLVIDHVCGQSACVRPEHLEAVSQGENITRKLNRQRALAAQRFRSGTMKGQLARK